MDTRELMSRVVSFSRETLKSTLIVELTTVISFELSGTEDAKVHSSSSFAALVLLWARLELGPEMSPPRRSMVPAAGAGGLTDCWYWNGEPWRGVDVREAKGSGVREAGAGAGENVADGGGEENCCGDDAERDPDANRSVIAWFEAFWCWGTGTPERPRTDPFDPPSDMLPD